MDYTSTTPVLYLYYTVPIQYIYNTYPVPTDLTILDYPRHAHGRTREEQKLDYTGLYYVRLY